MQRKAIAAGEPPAVAARGLGLCDVLEVEIVDAQVPWLLRELDKTMARAAAESDDASPDSDGAEYERALLGAMRERLAVEPREVPLTLVGPSGLVIALVRGAMRNATAALSELAGSDQRLTADGLAALRQLGAAAAECTEAFADCEAVISFNFDSQADPQRAW